MADFQELLVHSYGPAGLICVVLWFLREQLKEMKDDIREMKEELRPLPGLVSRMDNFDNELSELKRRVYQ